jgi:EAL domain-containing protein (putative c-di-GMP-specific phosphodiesterase class I)
VARFGGDEFALLLEDINNVSEAMLIAERIQDGLSRPFHLDEHTIYTTASIGITFSSAAYSQPEELLRDADTAMYRAKARGKAGYEVFDKTMHTHAVALLGLENDLRHAIERREFLVYYQPVVSLRSGNISGFEALVRWKHPQHGILTPDKFISVAEDTGLITHIGKYVLREACAQLSLWQTTYSMNPPLWISVNLSARELAQPGLVENVREALGQGTLDGSCLRLEITESAVMDDPIGAVNILTRLHELGIHLCIDDFGTGYSSLSYLHRFPIDTLKIDRSFVSGADGKLANQTITATILALSSGLGLDVVAEGVETPKQLELLRSMKCRYAQGYLFSRPVDANGAARLLSATPAW